MSRIGNAPISVPSGVDVNVDGRTISIKGPRGELSRELPGAITVEVDGDTLRCARPNDENESKALHGLTRSLVNNMVIGVTDGFKKELEIVGVGWNAAAQANKLGMSRLVFPGQVLRIPAPPPPPDY